MKARPGKFAEAVKTYITRQACNPIFNSSTKLSFHETATPLHCCWYSGFA